MRRVLILFFVGLQSLLAGLILPAQVLGLLGLYRPALVIPAALLVTVLTLWASLQYGWKFYQQIFPPFEINGRRAWLDAGIGVAALVILILLVVLPVARWPFSPISETLHWDAGAYHFPKALELLNTGSANDFSISYGEYPFGYESLLSAAAMLDRGGSLFGAAHLLAVLYFIFAFCFLLRRFTSLPGGITFYFVATLATAGVFLWVSRTSWFIYRYLVYTIGKNDLFLAACLLAVILHAPIGPRENQRAWFPLGMAFATFLAAATKPNGLLVSAPLWLIALPYLWQDVALERKSHPAGPQAWKIFSCRVFVLGLVILPGALWLARNFILQGRAFSPDVTRLQQWSILHNLTNPYFYNYIPPELIQILAAGGLTLLLAIFIRRIHWTLPATYFILLFTFAYTAQSGFYGSNQKPTDIGWRFGVTLITFSAVLIVTWASPRLNKAYAWLHRYRVLQLLGLLAILVLTGRYLWEFRAVLKTYPGHEIVLRDQFRDPVGVGGYHSPYDYVYQNVQHSVVWVENGLNYYAYGREYTNSTTRSRKPDYVIVLQTAWWGGDPHYPELVASPEWDQNYRIVYEDSEGRVYQRRSNVP